MDSDRFDGLVKRFARRASRRKVLKGLGEGTVAGGLALAGIGPAAAAAEKVTVCHKPGTPAEKTMAVPPSAVGDHLGHGDYAGGCCPAGDDVCVDAGGAGTCCPQPGRCLADGTCCAPDCTRKCGGAADGCGGTCTGTCGDGKFCENGGCFKACDVGGAGCSGASCGTTCVCDVSTDTPDGGCADYDFFVGSCDSNADCPDGTRCSAFIVDPQGRNLCTRPCSCPA